MSNFVSLVVKVYSKSMRQETKTRKHLKLLKNCAYAGPPYTLNMTLRQM